MSDYIDLVLCKHASLDRLVPFEAPAWSNLKKGDSVKVEGGIMGHRVVEVVKTLTIEKKSEELDFILTLIDPPMPLRKIKSKLIYQDFEYEEETDGTDNDK